MKLFLFIVGEVSIFLFVISYFLMPLFGAPFYPSTFKTIDSILKLVPISKDKLIVDLGSGDGRIVYQFAKRGYNVRGIEINLFFVIFSNLLLLFTGNIKRGRVYWGNVFKFDLGKYDLVYCYLYPGFMKRLSPKFKKELKPGARIISNTFKLKDWELINHIDKTYLYRVK